MNTAIKESESAEQTAETDETDAQQLWDDFEGDDQNDDQPEDGDDTFAEDEGDDPDDDQIEKDTAITDPKELQSQIDRLTHSLKSEQGRTASQRRQVETLRSQMAEAEQSAPSDDNEEKLTARREKMDKAKEDYGDVVSPLVETIEELQAQMGNLGKRDAQNLEDKKTQLASIVQEQESVLTAEHPDWNEVLSANKATFDVWIEDQPKAVRDAYARNSGDIVDGNEASLLVSQFKQSLLSASGFDESASDTNKNDRAAARRKRQIDGSRSTRSGSSRATSEPAPNGEDAQATWNYFERRDQKKDRR